MLSFKNFLENQEHSSAETSRNQVSAGLKYALQKGFINPKSLNVDHGGGAYDTGKTHIEKNSKGSILHIHDPYNRSPEHNAHVRKHAKGNADYVGLHNVLNVIKEPEHRKNALKTMKTFMKPKTGIAHITVYEGDQSGKSKITKHDKGKGSSWQEHRPVASYLDEIKTVFPEKTHDVTLQGKHFIVRQK